MKRKIITTSDGSKTIQIEEWNEQYHSIHGALNEANHVFIKYGLRYTLGLSDSDKPLSILEIGFGTGLNAFLTLIEAEKLKQHIYYVGVEAYPVEDAEVKALDYPQFISPKYSGKFDKMHKVEWERCVPISDYFQIEKQQKFFKDIEAVSNFDLIYFDAFGARVQPELWTEVVFTKMFIVLKSRGVLVTYSAKGSVRRAMQAVGFTVERLPGPPGKREMLRAQKVS